MRLRLIFLSFMLFFGIGANGQSNLGSTSEVKAKQDSIIAKYLTRGAHQYGYFSKEWTEYIDKGLEQDSTIAYLWQQKAMPLFKKRKYELGMGYLNKAVYYDKSWLAYRAFIKCIFAKTYSESLIDFREARKINGNSGVMDHSYDFYMALCHLQLNQYQEARKLLKSVVEKSEKDFGVDWVHHLDLFYLGICYYELGELDLAIVIFDRAIARYPKFSDAKYYKAKCLYLKGHHIYGNELLKEANRDFKEGFSINEDNSIYETYPYEVNWKMVRL